MLSQHSEVGQGLTCFLTGKKLKENHFKLNDYQPFPYKRASSRICLSEAS